MSDFQLLSHDPLKTEWFSYDELTGEEVIKTEYHGTDAVLDINKAIQGRDVGKGSDDTQRLMASIPASVIHKWLIEDGINFFSKADWPRVVQKLDSNEYRHLRVNTGRIGMRRKMF